MLFDRHRTSFGLVLPVRDRETASTDFDFRRQLALADKADRLGLHAIWVRDVPLNSQSYPDPIGHSDPWVLLGALGASTSNVTLVTGAVVLPLRHPLHVAKAARSVSALSGGRFVLGLGSGDRASEYAMFGQAHDERKTLFRKSWERVEAALNDPQVLLDDDLASHPEFELRPAAPAAVPMLAVGSSSQSLEWIARRSVGWMTYYRQLSAQRDRIGLWRRAVTKTTADFRGFGQSMALELSDRSDAPLEELALGQRGGRLAIRRSIEGMIEAGIQHVAFNIVTGSRPADEVIVELAQDVLSEF